MRPASVMCPDEPEGGAGSVDRVTDDPPQNATPDFVLP
jgi:hypothetical protein